MREESKIYIFITLTGVLSGVLGGLVATSISETLPLILGVAAIVFYLGARSIPMIFETEEDKKVSGRMRSNFFGFLIGWIWGIAFAYSLLNPPEAGKYLNETESLISFYL